MLFDSTSLRVSSFWLVVSKSTATFLLLAKTTCQLLGNCDNDSPVDSVLGKLFQDIIQLFELSNLSLRLDFTCNGHV